MKTTLKSYVTWRLQSHSTNHLENDSEIFVFLHEAESLLLPCAHCGRAHPHIMHRFYPKNNEHAHEVYVDCCQYNTDPLPVIEGCHIRSQSRFATDDESSLKEALQLVCKEWNRRTTQNQ